jgi:hypothetical protein
VELSTEIEIFTAGSILTDWLKIFNNLPSDLKGLMNEKTQFKIALKRYLNTHSFYSVDENLLCRKLFVYL